MNFQDIGQDEEGKYLEEYKDYDEEEDDEDEDPNNPFFGGANPPITMEDFFMHWANLENRSQKH